LRVGFFMVTLGIILREFVLAEYKRSITPLVSIKRYTFIKMSNKKSEHPGKCPLINLLNSTKYHESRLIGTT